MRRSASIPATETPNAGWRSALHEVIYEAETPAGRAFDVALIWLILLSVVAMLLESVRSVRAEYGRILYAAEWIFTVLFTVEYFLRLVGVRRPFHYATSFFGVVDLLAIIPTYLSLLVPGSQYLLVIRILRLLRVFRVFKLAEHSTEADVLMPLCAPAAVTVEIAQAARKQVSARACPACSAEEQDAEAVYCKYCGSTLKRVEDDCWR